MLSNGRSMRWRWPATIRLRIMPTLVKSFGFLPLQPYVVWCAKAMAHLISTMETAAGAGSAVAKHRSSTMLPYYTRYHEMLVEDVRSWSYMKFPFIKDIRPR